MITILLVALCVVTAHAQHFGQYYSCPPSSVADHQFRMLTSNMNPLELPILTQAKQDMDEAPSEIQELAKASLSKALTYHKEYQLLIRPFVDRCCKKPEYKCSSVKIPLRFIWYYYYYHFCFVVYPPDELSYTKCTCMTCIQDCNCPVIGRCVEANYRSRFMVVYCPKFPSRSRYMFMMVVVPESCKCLTYCPYNFHFNRGFAKSAPTSVEGAAAASSPASAPSSVTGEAANEQGAPAEGIP